MAATEPLDILIQAIATKWAATASLTSAIAGPWRGERPTNATANPASGTLTPYCIVPDESKGGEPSQLFAYSCGNEYWRHEIKFRVYDTSQSACAAGLALVDAVFRPTSSPLALTLAAGSLLKNRLIRTRYVMEDKNKWYGELTLEFDTSRPIA